jgi:hypothetical protein
VNRHDRVDGRICSEDGAVGGDRRTALDLEAHFCPLLDLGNRTVGKNLSAAFLEIG